jgi:hypothetical protein
MIGRYSPINNSTADGEFLDSLFVCDPAVNAPKDKMHDYFFIYLTIDEQYRPITL